MPLKDLFLRPVDRPIEGVIKADDEASLRLEIEEYVLTNEVAKRLQDFLSAYNSYQGANGVWVSGFFGSGKSHLLKMLALLLENRSIDGAQALELFTGKIDDAILQADLARAAAIPSKSILFNIDQKADVINKNQVDALLAVFVKVFDDMCGYYGKQGYIAQFERDLDSRGQYADFMAAYEAIAGKHWHVGREQALLEGGNIAKAYATATGAEAVMAQGILDKYRSQYRVSIEDFADQVFAYITAQGPQFRLNFFVDEVGQYIADNTKLMTNLQTIAESLATKCRGRAWIVVTAQEDMSSVVGEMDTKQGNDFTKIQARFQNRLKLTSADVAEVIQKRLLLKTKDGATQLSSLYDTQVNNFKTLFDFADGSQTYRNFKDKEHFIDSYPFIPYQFALFQSAIQNLSLHNAFEGKHSSVGERSMLGVFQQVAIQIGAYEAGQLATFDLMFAGIRAALKSQIQKAVIQAENHLSDEFAIRLLKALFLVKYVKEFKPTIRNLCVLMLERFDQDLPALRQRVEEALNRLEQETYIQRNGEHYEYLTDEEKDIEQEIKAVDIESSDVAAELDKIIFDYVIKQRKIRIGEQGQDYPFSRKLDDRLSGREYELAIHVISPFHEHADSHDILQMQNTGKSELLVVMPSDSRVMEDVEMYLRTAKYVQPNIRSALQDSTRRILHDKGLQNSERYAEIQQRVQTLIAQARLFVQGSEFEAGNVDAQTRVQRGFQELVGRAYPNLAMLRGVVYIEHDVAKYLAQMKGTLTGVENTITEAETEMLGFINTNSRTGVRTTLKTLLEHFERKPYGWYYAAILCTLGKLCGRGKVEVRSDGSLVEDAELERALRNTQAHANLVLEPQIEFTASQARALREFYEDFFGQSPTAKEAKAIAKQTGDSLAGLVKDIESKLKTQAAGYPFCDKLISVELLLKQATGKPYDWYLTDFAKHQDALLSAKESVLDPMRKFLEGPQREIYDSTRKFFEEQGSNLAYLGTQEAEQAKSILNNAECYMGDKMQQLKTHLENLQQQVRPILMAEVQKAESQLAEMQKRLCESSEFVKLAEEQQKRLSQVFEKSAAMLAHEKLIAAVRDTVRRFEEVQYPELLSQLTALTQTAPVKAPQPPTGTSQETPAPTPQPEPVKPVEFISSRSLSITFDKAWLADEGDVERYLESMRKALLEEIRQGKRIQI